MKVLSGALKSILRAHSSTTIAKGKRLYDKTLRGSLEPIELLVDEEGDEDEDFMLIVPSESGGEGYEVSIYPEMEAEEGCYCECLAFEETDECKHTVAAVLFLMDEVKEDSVEKSTPTTAPASPPPTDSSAPGVKLTLLIEPQAFFRHFTNLIPPVYTYQGEQKRLKNYREHREQRTLTASYQQTAKSIFHPSIAYDGRDFFTLSCSCTDAGFCSHLKAFVSFVHKQEGTNYFITLKDFTQEKAAILEKLGFEPGSAEAAAVLFSVDKWNGSLTYTPPTWLFRAEEADALVKHTQEALGLPHLTGADEPLVPATKPLQLEVVLHTATTNLPFDLELTVVNNANGKFAKVNLNNTDRWPELRASLPAEAYEALIALSAPRLTEGLRAAGHWESLSSLSSYRRYGGMQKAIDALRKIYAHGLRRLWPWLSSGSVPVYTSDAAKPAADTATRIALHPQPVQAAVHLSRDSRFVTMALTFVAGDEVLKGLSPVAELLLRKGDTWYLPDGDKTQKLMRQFPDGFAKIPLAAEGAIVGKLLPSLRAGGIDVTLDPSINIRPLSLPLQPVLHLAEHGGKQLVLQARYGYGNAVLSGDATAAPVLLPPPTGEDGWIELQRDPEGEATFRQQVKSLHPDFEAQQGAAFFLPFADALVDNWYSRSFLSLSEAGVRITGQEALQHFRYNPNTAKVSVQSKEGGTGIDWFDLEIEISFGDQKASLKEVRKAIMERQAGVRLPDGTIGLLPEEFIREYGALFKLGQEKDGALRVNALHYTLIDSLHEATLDNRMRQAIEERKARLASIDHLKEAELPKGLQATMRPYQTAGYQWMQSLHEIGWGGCLADDMGLGKTLQTIAWLQKVKEEKPGEVHLVVCPTSLLYNWQSELDKFAPGIRYHLYYGADRVWNKKLQKGTDVVLTSYGIARSDLQKINKTVWYGLVLDESQAIKNPLAQITKAVQLIPARQRFCLSGTPLQNNTYDLYAQFSFLNPGLLGAPDFFRTQFANPIDKAADEPARTGLRRMLAPFMLRRTKEQVAKDLPDKTEVTLWCEMEPAQRAVYDEYRNYYRDALLKRIEKEGMASSAIFVLEALLRLRQLCDHPALVKNREVKTSESVKLAQLRRELTENTGERKVLIFSQFTEMLTLIGAMLEEAGLPYVRLDGKTAASKRAEAVDKFQTEPHIRVFLISLKAGGVGLNLTAAEYVYLVDPWWNPAVEAQAIDRTHRIGQQNKIVAFRMICKDTVEEKVMQLQQKKKALADELVTEDAGFVKKLTKDDVAFLLQ